MLISILLTITLNLDALAIGVSYGIRNIRIPFSSFLLISLISVFGTGLARFFGNAFTVLFPPVLGAILLIGIGIYTFYSAFRDAETFDFDCSKSIDLREAIVLALALTFDAAGAVFSLAISDVVSLFLPIAIGACQLCFLWLGKKIGTRISKERNTRAFHILSGVILTLLGLLFLVL